LWRTSGFETAGSELQDFSRVELVNLVQIRRTQPERIQHADAFRDEHGADLWIERAIRSEQAMAGAEEPLTAWGGGLRSEQRRVRVEHLELFDRALLQRTIFFAATVGEFQPSGEPKSYDLR
jgi:hypothetical protein